MSRSLIERSEHRPRTVRTPSSGMPWRAGWTPILAALLSGCLVTPGPKPGVAPETEDVAAPKSDDLARIERLYEAGDYTEALRAAMDASRVNPDQAELVLWRERIHAAIVETRAEALARTHETSALRIALEASEKNLLPETYGLRRRIEPLPTDSLLPDSRMREVLNRPVTMHLRGANLSRLIEALALDPDLNIIADQGLGQGKTLDVEVANVPLREVMDYISRNLDVHFHMGENVIWATAPDARRGGPLETRVYRLRKGLQFEGSDWGEPAEDAAAGAISVLTRKATVLPSKTTSIETLLQRFVPETDGALMTLDVNTHTLLVRNTRENLELIERIVSALDVDPPQVLIEAHFMEVVVADLRELGLEWMLNSAFQLGSRSLIAKGGQIAFKPFTSDEGGTTPLGPQGAFGQTRPGNPPTAGQGLNLAIQGVLTRPMFQAALHALEISGKGRTISAPRVTTLNNNPAKLRDGQDLRYFDEFQAQAFNLVDAANQRYTITVLIPKGSPSMEELGITLVAVPSVGADRKTISLLLNPTISRLEGFVSYQDDTGVPTNNPDRIRQVVAKLPIFSRREIQTKLVVESGETVVMGGLIDTVSQDTVHRVPVLGWLPLIGHLFQRTATTEQRKNLLIFVTATVISERGESLRTVGPVQPLPADPSPTP